jgi:hypothetical protein
MCGAFIASLSLAALMLAANETFAETRTTFTGGFNPWHSIGPRVAQSMVHHRTNDVGALWFEGGFFDGSSNGEPMVDPTQPTSGDVHYTYTNDVPWDWVHRYPPAVTPSERPYVPSCPTETVKFSGHDGNEQTVNVMRCY